MSTKATHVDIYPMETLSSMVVVKRRDNEADYQHDSKSNRDEVELAHFGKRQQLKVSILDRTISPSSTTPFANLFFFRQRTFGLVSMTGLTCTLMVTWEGILMSVVRSAFFIRTKPPIRRLTRVPVRLLLAWAMAVRQAWYMVISLSGRGR